MKRNDRKHRLGLVLLFAMSLVLTSAVTVATAAESGTVSGTVELDGQPLPDVEVFLWANGARLTCTDSNGEFVFEDVPFDTRLLSATGPGHPEHCKNYRFKAPDGAVVLVQFYDGHDGMGPFDEFMISAATPDYVIDYTPRRARADEKVCWNHLATIVGTDGDDVINTTMGGEVVYAGKGNDVIIGSDNPFELLCGGPGRDTIYGYAGADTLVGGPGFDRLFGGTGDDVLFGGGNRDILRGQAGADAILGEAGKDTLRGGPGRDVIRGGTGDDVLRGEKGNDWLYGGAGHDAAYGGAGFDRCWAETEVSCR